MKNLIKSFMFAVAMLLAVSVQAENKPETVAGTNPESAIVVTVQPNDVQQVPCVVYVYVCGKYYQFPVVFSGGDCGLIGITIQTFIDNISSCN